MAKVGVYVHHHVPGALSAPAFVLRKHMAPDALTSGAIVVMERETGLEPVTLSLES